MNIDEIISVVPEHQQWVKFDPQIGADEEETLEELDKDQDYISSFRTRHPVQVRPIQYLSSMFSKSELQTADSLSSWIISKKLSRSQAQIKSDSSILSQVTHVSLAGGVFVIPDELVLEFYRRYAINLLKGGHMYFGERPSPVMRFVLDLDFKHTLVLSTRQVECVAKIIQQVVVDYFPKDQNCECIVSGAPYKTLETSKVPQSLISESSDIVSDSVPMSAAAAAAAAATPSSKAVSNVLIKTGVHITWTHLFLRVSAMREIRNAIVETCQEHFGRRNEPANSWDSVIDDSVYSSSGLRMIGSYKTEKCPRCLGKKDLKEFCETCVRRGRVDDARSYWPMFVLDNRGNRIRERELLYCNNTVQLVCDTVIRADSSKDLTDSAFRSKLSLSEQSKLSKVSASTSESKGRHRKKDAVPESNAVFEASKTKLIDNSHVDDIEKFIRTIRNYEELQIDRILVDKRKTKYIVCPRSNHCGRFCMNKRAEHSSNRIYFELTLQNGCVQKCTKKEDNHEKCLTHKPCSEFRSRSFSIPASLRSLLFHTTTTTTSSARVQFESEFTLAEKRRKQARFEIYQSILNHSFGVLGWEKIDSLSELVAHGKIGCDGSGLGTRGRAALKEFGIVEDCKLPQETPKVRVARVCDEVLADLNPSLELDLLYEQVCSQIEQYVLTMTGFSS